MPIRILGISAYYHDSAACLVEDGRIVAAAQEERFTRKKHDAGFPSHAVQYCLREAGVEARDLDLVGFYEKPLVKFDRLLETYIACAPKGLKSYLMAMPLWLGQRLWMADDIKRQVEGYEGEVLFGEHHESHAASAFYPSPFEHAAVVTIDGVGEWATSSIGVGRGNDLELLRELRFPHSLGLLYSAFTYFTGFRVNSGEYKLMGLAPYGEPNYVQRIKDELLEIRDDGSLWMNLAYFTYPHGLRMTGGAFEQLFDGPRVVDPDEAAQGASSLPPDGADGRNGELLCAAHAESHVPVRVLARCSRNVVPDVRFAQVAEQSHELVIPRSRTLDTLSRSIQN